MAITENAKIDVFGTADILTETTPAAVASAAWSTLTNMPAWTNDDDVAEASVTLDGVLGVAAAANKSIDLYVRKINVIDTSDDDNAIDDEFPHEYLGSFPMDEATAQIYTIRVALPNYKTSSEFEFIIYNRSGQSLSSGWKMQITPITDAPHPA